MTRSRLAFLAVVLLLAAAATAWSTPFPGRSPLGYPGEPEPVAQGSHWTINHISAALHIANRTHHSAIAVRCVNAAGTHWESCGGGGSSSSSVTGTLDSLGHISSVTHVLGSVYLTGKNGTAVTTTGTALDVNCTGCSAASVVNVGHISSAVHVVGVVACSNCSGGPGGTGDAVNVFHQSTIRHVSSLTHVVVVDWQRWAHVASAQSGAWNVTAHQGGSWTIAHISSALHIAGVVSVTCANCSGGSGDAVNVFHQSTVRHVSSLTHVVIVDWQRWAHVAAAQSGVWNIVAHQGGTWVVGDNTNVFHQSTVRHISSLTHVVIVDWQRWAHVASAQSGLWNVTAHQGGTWTVAATQSGEWNVRHVSMLQHVVIVDWQRWAHVASAQSGVWNVVAHQGGAWTNLNVAHIASVVHVAGYGTFLVNLHGGASSSVAQSGVWNVTAHLSGTSNIAHITSVTHITGSVFLRSQAGTAVTVTGTALDVNCTGCAAASVVNVGHISSVTHVTIVGSAHQSGAIHVAGISNIGSGNDGTGTTSMVCHSTLAIHVGGSSGMVFTLVHLTSSNGGLNQANWRIYICSVLLYTNAASPTLNPPANANGPVPGATRHFAAAFSLVEGSGTDCATNTLGVVGWPQTTPSSAQARGGSIPLYNHTVSAVWISPFPFISTQKTGNSLCLQHNITNSATYLTGAISYRAGQ